MQSASNGQPRLKLSFAGDGFPQGAVPLTIIAIKLQALQQAMFHAAAAASGHLGERRGLWYNRYRFAAELTFADAHHSELVVEAALAVNPVLTDEFNVGLKAVDILFDAAVSIQNDQLETLKLSRNDRDYLLRALEGLMPNIGDQYQIRLENCHSEKHPTVTFDADSRRRIRDYTSQEEATFGPQEEVSVVGELIKIYVDAGEDKITVRSMQRNIDCYYSDAMRDQVANLIAGAMVEVTGFATLNDRGQVDGLHQVTNVEHLSMEPLRIARFHGENRDFVLTSPVAVNVEYTDGLWIYHQPELNLWGYAPRREDALRDLNDSFAYQYRDIAEEDEANLDNVALQLRQKLLRLVEPPERTIVNA